MRQIQNADGTSWTVADLARRVLVSGTTVRQWIKGAIPEGRALGRLAEALEVEAQSLLKGEIKPVNLPAGSRSHDVTGIESVRAGDAANHANGQSASPTAAEVKALVSQRLAEWRRSGVAPPDWEVMTWLDLAMRARRSGPSG